MAVPPLPEDVMSASPWTGTGTGQGQSGNTVVWATASGSAAEGAMASMVQGHCSLVPGQQHALLWLARRSEWVQLADIRPCNQLGSGRTVYRQRLRIYTQTPVTDSVRQQKTCHHPIIIITITVPQTLAIIIAIRHAASVVNSVSPAVHKQAKHQPLASSEPLPRPGDVPVAHHDWCAIHTHVHCITYAAK